MMVSLLYTSRHQTFHNIFSAVYSGHSLPAALEELPLILSGKPPPSSSLHTRIGSNSFDKPPVALIVGGGYDDEKFGALYDACLKACGESKKNLGVPFFRVSNEITKKLEEEGKGPKIGGPGYPEAIAQRLKDRLAGLGIKAGMEGGVKEEVVGEVFFF